MKEKINDIISTNIKTSINLKNSLFNDFSIYEEIKNIVDQCIVSLTNNNTVWWCGNGGSAADAQHLAAELSGRFYFDREPLSSAALHVNTEAR